MKSDHQWRNHRRRNAVKPEINALRIRGFNLRWITPWQCRVNESLDLFLTNWRFHNIKTNDRGSFTKDNILALVRGELRRNDE